MAVCRKCSIGKVRIEGAVFIFFSRRETRRGGEEKCG